MNRLLMILAAVFTVHSAAVAADPAPQPATASLPVPTIAVLPFDSRGARAQDENLGKSIAELLSVELATQGDFELVERAELDKILTELHLSATGLVDKETQLRIPQRRQQLRRRQADRRRNRQGPAGRRQRRQRRHRSRLRAGGQGGQTADRPFPAADAQAENRALRRR